MAWTRFPSKYMTLVSLVGFLVLNLGMKLAIVLSIGEAPARQSRGLPIIPGDQVLLLSSNHDGPYGFQSDQEWAALIPGNGTVYVGSERKPFLVSMFHQFQCMDVIRNELKISKKDRDMRRARHCLNYLRQMTLCRGDTFLDPFQYLSKKGALARHPVRVCEDWRVLYKTVEANQIGKTDWVLSSFGAL